MRDFETKNVLIRKFRIEDSEDVFKNLASETKLMNCMGYTIHSNINETQRMVSSFINEYDMNEMIFAIECKKTNEVIGFFNAVERAEQDKIYKFKFGIALDYVNTGFMEESLVEICNYLFNEKNVNVLISEFFVGNEEVEKIKSNVLEKAGFTKEAVLHNRKINKKTGKYENKVIYSKFRQGI